MTTISSSLELFLELAKAQSVLTRRFDSGLNGLSLTEFMILLQLSQAKDGKLRRVDLAEKVGLTASGITRLLAPMEKIGLVEREAVEHDARVSLVALASGGRTKIVHSLEYAELLSTDLLQKVKTKNTEDFTKALKELSA